MPITNSPGGLPAGVDIRGLGGYTMAPDAVLPDGRSYQPFRTYSSLIASLKQGTVPVFPKALAEVVRRKRTKAASQSEPDQTQDRADGDFSRESIHARGLLDLHAEKLAAAPPGGRNEALNATAYLLGRMVGPGWVSVDLVRQRLLAASESNGAIADDGLEKAKDTIERGLSAGIAKPRTALPKEAASGGLDTAALAARLAPTPFEYVDPALLPRRDWIYNFYYIGKFVTATVAPGGMGKTSLGMVEAIAIATGSNILGVLPKRRAKVWCWNGEDPKDEIERRVAGIMLHYRIDPPEIEGWLFLDSGRTMPITLAAQDKSGTKIAEPVVEKLITVIKERGIGLLIIDPFVSSHQVTENDNNAIAAVAQSWSRIADATGCAIELVHHARKTGGNEVGVEDGRGASALVAAARGVRVLNGMTKDEAEKAGVPEEDRRLYFRVDKGKSNLSRPALGAEWYMLASVSLGNGPDPENPDFDADSVGVVTKYEYVETSLEVTPEQEVQICKLLAHGKGRYDSRSPNWVGHEVTALINSSTKEKCDKSAVKGLIDDLIGKGFLAKYEAKDEKGRPRTFITLGKNSPVM
jgi:hypothetical protein